MKRVVVSAPLRVSLGGGGTDLPAYADRFGALIVAAAIDRRISIEITRGGDAAQADDEPALLTHAKRLHGVPDARVRGLGDDAAVRGAGLGASGAFAVAVVAGLLALRGERLAPLPLAERAFELEREALGTPIGLQDPIVAAHGGLLTLHVHVGGRAHVERPAIDEAMTDALGTRLAAYFTGATRRAADVLVSQSARIEQSEEDALLAMHRIKAIGLETERALIRGDLAALGPLFDEHWSAKRRAVPRSSTPAFDETYRIAREAGAAGGKLMGAGGGGYWLFFVEPTARASVDRAMRARGLDPFAFSLGEPGARVELCSADA